MDQGVLLQATGLVLQQGKRTLLQQISLEISSGEIVTVIGPNGAGKTTLLRVLLKLLQPTAGGVVHQPQLRIGYLPQKLKIDPVLPLTVHRMMTLTARYSEVEVVEALELTGAAYLLESQMVNLSGGEFQRVMLARALLRNPQLLVLDEPVQGVDYLGESEMYRLIGQIREQYGCAVLMVSHDLHVVMASTDRVICLDHHICCQGAPADVSIHPEYLRLFGREEGILAVYSHDHDHQHELSGEVHQCDEECTHD